MSEPQSAPKPIIACLLFEPTRASNPLKLNGSITPEKSLALLRAMMSDLISFLASLKDYQPLVVAMTQPGEFLQQQTQAHQLPVIAISEEGSLDIGLRGRVYDAVITHIYKQAPHARLFLLDTHTPVFPEQYLSMGLRQFGRADLLMGPNPFGQVYLLGMQKPLPLFSSLDFQDPDMLKKLVAFCQAKGISHKLLPVWYSVSTIDDIDFLVEHLNVKVANQTLKESQTLKLLTTSDFRAGG